MPNTTPAKEKDVTPQQINQEAKEKAVDDLRVKIETIRIKTRPWRTSSATARPSPTPAPTKKKAGATIAKSWDIIKKTVGHQEATNTTQTRVKARGKANRQPNLLDSQNLQKVLGNHDLKPLPEVNEKVKVTTKAKGTATRTRLGKTLHETLLKYRANFTPKAPVLTVRHAYSNIDK